MFVRHGVTLVAASVLAVAGCSSAQDDEAQKDGARKGGGNDIAVTATDDSCEIATTDLKPGSHTFAVRNEGTKVTEFYVYQGQKVVSEVEDIAPGTARNLTVELSAGRYQGACKPGMEGDGIRADITVKA